MTLNRPPQYSNYAFMNAQRKKYFKKASPETQTKRRNQQNADRNICPVHFIAVPVATGRCESC